MTLTSPNGGESWVRNSIRNITWNHSSPGGTVSILLYKNKAYVGTIATSLDIISRSLSWKGAA